MLEGLCGNKNVARILIFLFVNGKCYGTQLHKFLKTSLTPIQKALLRLEKGGIIISHLEGKTRLYQFNPAFPILHEMEEMLKKTYTLLPAHEKKDYYVPKEESSIRFAHPQNRIKILSEFWEKLTLVRKLSFNAKTKAKDATGWNGKGAGEVSILKEGTHMLLFNEKGTWNGGGKDQMSFSNIFRWSFDRDAGMISLEHLRRGVNHPVFLFHLVPSGNFSLSSVDSHLCDGDTYFGQVHFDRYGLRLNWRVIGPKKNEEIDYYYS